MGYIDDHEYDLACTDCGNSEVVKSLDKGNRHSGSYWTVPDFRSFKVVTSGGGHIIPRVSSAVCRACGTKVR